MFYNICIIYLFYSYNENEIEKTEERINHMNEFEKTIENIYIKYHKEKTYQHVFNVAKNACLLAKQYHVDIDKVKIASLLHDISAIISADKMYEIAEKRQLWIDPAEEKYHFLLHQRISKIIAEEYFHIKDKDILSSIECHTTLKKEANDYDKIVFLADKLSWDQEGIPPYYKELKQAVNHSLDEGCYCYLQYQFDHHLLLMPHGWLLDAYKNLKYYMTEKNSNGNRR